MGAFRKDHACSVGAHVARDAREDVGARADVHREAELARGDAHRLVHGERERRAAERCRVDPEQEVVHDRVPDERDLEDVVAFDLGCVRELRGELREAAANDFRELLLGAGVEHDVRDAAHEVLAEPDLRVHLSCGCEHLTRPEVAQVSGDRRRPDVEGDPVGVVVEARPDARDRLPVVDGDRDSSLTRSQRGL
jgi:hypothetical protein